MILIRKKAAPMELESLKVDAERRSLSESDAYNLLRNPLKNEVRESLMNEQGHICAYCMRRIPDERIKDTDEDLSNVYIEHWRPRSEKSVEHNLSLDYNNMLAVCSGNAKAPESEGRRKKRFFTCDRKRENRTLTVNPLIQDTIDTIYYLNDGSIRSTDANIDRDLNETLNLNCSLDAMTLPSCRKSVLEEVQKALFMQEGDVKSNCIDQLKFWESETDPKTPYIGIAIWWLKEQINAM